MIRLIRRILVVALAAVLLTGTAAVSADAMMQRTVMKQSGATSPKHLKKASKVKKGTTKLIFPKGEGHMKFTAPSTKTYRFTFSDMKVKGETLAYVDFTKRDKTDPSKMVWLNVPTNGGKNTMLNLVSKGWSSITYNNPKVNRCLHSRYGKVKLKKGETVLIHFYSTQSENYKEHKKVNKVTLKMVIK